MVKALKQFSMKKCCMILLFSLYFGQCSEMAENNYDPHTIDIYQRDTFIDIDKTFYNESLNRPVLVKENPATKEIIVLDHGNNCIYFFSQKGEFLRKVGQRGQGPGDLSYPEYLAVDSDGSIYVYEFFNKRISIFSNDGIFKSSFRISLPRNPQFFITKDKKILVRVANSNYYITVLTKNGEKINEIGEIQHFNDKLKKINILYNDCICFENNDGDYVVFLKHLPIVKVYDKDGNLKIEKELYDELRTKEIHNPKIMSENIMYIIYYQEIVYRDSNYYLFRGYNRDVRDRNKVIVNVLDDNFVNAKNIFLPLQEKYNRDEFGFDMKCDVSHNLDFIIMPFTQYSEIHKFYPKN